MKTLHFLLGILVIAAFVAMVNRGKSPALGSTPQQADAEHRATPSHRMSRPGSSSGLARAERIAAMASQIESAIGSEDSERQRVFSEVLAALVDLDPLAAADLLAKIEPGPVREEYLLRLAQIWSARDAAAALRWASSLQDEPERASTVRTLCVEIGQGDPEAAIRTMEELSLADASTLDNLAQLWADKDITAATDWALAKPAGGSRDGLLSRIAFVMAEQSPREAATLVVEKIPPGETQTEAAISIVHRWALQDWNSAKEWVDLFPEGRLRERAQHEIAGIKDYTEALKQPRTTQ